MANQKDMKPIVFCNIGWNTYYIGEEGGPLKGGGAYVRKNGTGNEHLNYLPIFVSEEGSGDEKTMLLGSFETKSNRGISNQTHIEKIRGCSSLRRENFADDVIVVWCAKHPEGKTCVVGWYKHATIYRFYQVIPVDREDGSERERWYNVCCKYEDAVLLPEDIRGEPCWAIPRHSVNNPVSYGFGQANIWYASEADAEEFVERMIHQVENYAGEDIKVELM